MNLILDVTVAEVITDYINRTSPVYPDVEGRIKFAIDENKSMQNELNKLFTSSAIRYVYQIPIISICIALMRLL
jgi:hypothetical protein